MANNVQHLLNVLEVDNKQAKDALRALLHTILFNRAIGAIVPEERELESFPETTYACCGDSKVDAAVEKGIEKFCQSLQLVGPDLYRGEIILSFFETKKKVGFLGIGTPGEEKVYWERWVIPMIVHKGSLQTVSSESALRSNMFRILHLCNDLSHVPKFRPDSSGTPVYKYDVIVPQASTETATSSSAKQKLGGVFNQILSGGSDSSLRFTL